MPNIPIKPSASPSNVPQSVNPAISGPKFPSTKPPIVSPKVIEKKVFSGIRTLPGGMKKEHVVELVDRSDDASQMLPFQFTCTTCHYEGKTKSYNEALVLAQRHVGL